MNRKRIVLCLDGTWNNPYDEQQRDDGNKVLRPSNTLKLARAVLPMAADEHEQLVYYDIGVGSLAAYPGAANRLLYRADRVLGGGFGAGFEGNVEDALSFIAMNFVPGDEVFIFGFSRGAAAARAVTRFLQWSGGVPQKADVYFLPRLFRAYVVGRGEPAKFDAEIAAINAELTRDKKDLLLPMLPVEITYLGVWDTVAALGSLAHLLRANPDNAERSFHIGKSPVRFVRNARHALAIDERRLDFRPEIWIGPADPQQKIEQRWFAGVHSNVGGGYVHDGLANITFHWILKGATDLKLDIDDDFVKFFRKFHRGTQYESQTRKYRVFEFVRGRRGKGVRELTGHPASANLELDPSVIDRMREPAEALQPIDKKSKVTEPYRPNNVIRFLAEQPDLDTFLTGIGSPGPLPADVMQRIGKIRSDRR